MLELCDLSRRFGETVAVDGLSFTVAAGQMLGFVGPNGAGKTTTMRLVMGLLAADRGELRWRDETLDRARRRRFGYMPEERGLYPKMRVGEQLSYFARLHGLDAAAADAAATGWMDRLGVAERRDEEVQALSLGNQQRVQLAAALVHDPELLILDEPFSGIDPVGVEVLAGVLGEQTRRDVPVVFSSHQLELVERLCDAVVIVREGRVVAAGKVEELRLAHGGRRYRLALDPSPQSSAWVRAVPGVRSVEEEPDAVICTLTADADEQALLDAGRAAGRVRAFAPVLPSLTELFREALAE